MPDVRFEISADAGELLRAEGAVVRQQEQMEKGFAKVAAAAQSSSRQTAIAIKSLADQAEAAAKRINAASFAFGGSGGSGRSFRPYGLSPAAAAQSEMTRIAQYQGEILAMRRRDGLNSFTALPAADPFAARNAAEAVARQVREGKFGGSRGGGGAVATGGDGGGIGGVGGINTYLAGQMITQGLNFAVSAAGKYSDTISVAAQSNAEFEKSLGKVFSLGDNFKRMDYWRDQVLALSGAWGIAAPEITVALADVQRMMQGAGEAQQRSMLASSHQLTDLMGGNLSDNIKSAAKLMQAFGAEAGTAAQINSKLFALYRGGMAPEDVDLIARMSIATKEAGINANETLAVFKTITTLGGSNPLLVQGFRQFVQHLDVMKQHGMDLGGGDIGEKFQNLAKFASENPDLIAKILPARSGAAASIKALAENIDLLRKNLAELKGVTGGELGAATVARMADPAAGGAMIITRLNQELANVQTQRGRDPETIAEETRGIAWEIGHRLHTPAWQLALEDPEKQKAMRAAAMKGMGGDDVIAGLFKLTSDLRASKTPADSMLADMIELANGPAFGAQIGTRHRRLPPGYQAVKDIGEPIYAGPNEAAEYGSLRGRGFDLNLSTYQVYKKLQGQGNAAGAQSLLYGTRSPQTVHGDFGSAVAAFADAVRVLAGAMPMRVLLPGTSPATQPSVPLGRRVANQQ